MRIKEDVEALKEGLIDGTIDMVTTDHMPINIEQKKIEFDHAHYGTIGLESAFGALNSLFSTEQTIALLTSGKMRLGLKHHVIKQGQRADFTLFNPDKSYVFKQEHIMSKSKNAIFEGETLKGVVYGVISKNNILLNT